MLSPFLFVCGCGKKCHSRESMPSGWAVLHGALRCRRCVVLIGIGWVRVT